MKQACATQQTKIGGLERSTPSSAYRARPKTAVECPWSEMEWLRRWHRRSWFVGGVGDVTIRADGLVGMRRHCLRVWRLANPYFQIFIFLRLALLWEALLGGEYRHLRQCGRPPEIIISINCS